MVIHALFFYLFAAVTVASAAMVIFSRNPVHSVLFLILAFVNAAGLFVLIGAEFLAFILIIVYVGAVAVLFLFVVMMLDVDFAELRQGFINYLPIGTIIGIILFVELATVLAADVIGPDVAKAITAPIPAADQISNTQALGLVLYTRYVYFFQAAGVILLVAMIGAIVLTLQHKPNVKRQSIASQVRATKRAPSRSSRSSRGRGCHDHRAWALPRGRRDPVHARHHGDFPQPQERHRHPDVHRAHPARGEHQPRRVFELLGDIVGQVYALIVLTVAAAEAAIGLAILVAYFRNRGSIAVEDINLMKG